MSRLMEKVRNVVNKDEKRGYRHSDGSDDDEGGSQDIPQQSVSKSTRGGTSKRDRPDSDATWAPLPPSSKHEVLQEQLEGKNLEGVGQVDHGTGIPHRREDCQRNGSFGDDSAGVPH